MKKLALLLLLITSVMFSFSQSQRLVMLEHFTQASCGPCAGVNPGIHTLLVNNPDKLTCINFHTSWPGVDPMYNQNPTDPTSRVTYYNVTSVPHSVLDGNFFSGHPDDWNIAMVNQRWAIPSPFSLSVNQRLSATSDTLFVTMLVQATAPVTGDISAFMGVIEKHIHFNSAPGSNGEKDFYNVLKKMLPTKSGIALPTPMQTGDYAIIESYWVLANVYTLSELSVVSYIQNPLTKEVHQSANLNPELITAVYDNDVEASTFSNMLDRYCETSFSPKIAIRNNGNNNLTNLTIKYQLNDDDIQTYDWSGNLAFLEKAVIELPEISYTSDSNVLKVYVDQVNQVNDEYTKNDTLIHEFYRAYKVGRDIQVKVRTDNAPTEVTWTIVNSVGETVATGGPYTQNNKIYTENVVIDNDDCYNFYIYDSGGNGLCCGNGPGFFRLSTLSGTPVLAFGTEFGYESAAQFEVYTVGVNNPDLQNELKVYPNPASDMIYVETGSITKCKVSITNRLGQKVFESTTNSSKFEINSQSMPDGLYILSVESDQGVRISKINIAK